MKVEQEKEFKPVVITLQNNDEALMLRNFLSGYYENLEVNSKARDFIIEVINDLDECDF